MVIRLTPEETYIYIALFIIGYTDPSWAVVNNSLTDIIRERIGRYPESPHDTYDLDPIVILTFYDYDSEELAQAIYNSQSTPEEIKVYLKLKWGLGEY